MEEADRSLIATLTTIGAPFGAITSLKALGVAPFINVVTFCINTISESTCVILLPLAAVLREGLRNLLTPHPPSPPPYRVARAGG
jgi:hypothetical protein